MDVATKEGKYIYCIIKANKPKTFGPIGIGDRGDEVYSICLNNLAAVVSNAPIVKYSISRENMLTHEKAIEEVMKEHTVLPVRFATIAEDEEKVKKILEKECDKFKGLLDKIKGKKELGLKAIFKEDIYKKIVDEHEDIKKLKEAIASKSPEQTYYQRIKIGKMVEAALEKEKEEYKENILDVLGLLAEDVKINKTYGEKMVVNAAFLVDKDKEIEFDQNVQELDVKYGNKVKFKYVGMLPPFNFVNIVIETGNY